MGLTDEEIREVRRAKLKFALQKRAELNFEQNCVRIDHRLDVIEPGQKAIEDRAKQGELPETT